MLFGYTITYLRQAGVGSREPLTEWVRAKDRSEADRMLLAYARRTADAKDFLIIVPGAHGRAHFSFLGMTLTVVEEAEKAAS